MDNRTWAGFVTAVLSTGVAAGIVMSCMDQPRTKCQTGRGIFAAQYTPVSVPDGGCFLKGENIGIQPYNPANADNTAPDVEKSTVAIRGTQVGLALRPRTKPEELDTQEGHLPYALGAFATAEPGPDEFCDVPTFAPSVQELPPVPGEDAGPDGGGGKAPLPAATFKYEWSNVRFFVTAAQTGVQMQGDLRYTKDDCTAEYKVKAIYPTTPCFDTDDAGVKHVNEEKCLPPDLDKGRTGSAINADVVTYCDPELFLCLLAKDLPSNR